MVAIARTKISAGLDPRRIHSLLHQQNDDAKRGIVGLNQPNADVCLELSRHSYEALPKLVAIGDKAMIRCRGFLGCSGNRPDQTPSFINLANIVSNYRYYSGFWC